MSGVEIVGILLGSFPLIVSGLEHWRDVAKGGRFFWRVRKEYTRCSRDVQYHEIIYKRNLKELLLPVVDDPIEVDGLIHDPGGKQWSSEALQKKLEHRLQESYALYMDIIADMNETAEALRRELSLDNATIQGKLASKSSKPASTKAKWDYETFRVRFAFNEPVRKELFGHLRECNERLQKLLSTSKVAPPQTSEPATTGKRNSILEKAIRKAWKKSDLLFEALRRAWQCSCQPYHFANLRLEHRTLPEICFEVILTFVAPPTDADLPWTWKELECGEKVGCCSPRTTLKKTQSAALATKSSTLAKRRVKFTTSTPAIPRIELETIPEAKLRLCEVLGDVECGSCVGIIGHDSETYHLHALKKRKEPKNNGPLTLARILSSDFDMRPTRRQRYLIALLVASSVAQLQSTPWLRTGLTKHDILFFLEDDSQADTPYHEPFIQQGFSHQSSEASDTESHDCNFYSFGIVLLELCFGQGLEDQPLRKRYPPGESDAKQAYDLMAALKWVQSVGDEAGEDYASAVK